jgi:hypothetical protein
MMITIDMIGLEDKQTWCEGSGLARLDGTLSTMRHGDAAKELVEQSGHIESADVKSLARASRLYKAWWSDLERGRLGAHPCMRSLGPVDSPTP